MRILQIITSLGSGGAERLVVDLCNELSRQGEDVYLCIMLNPHDADYGFYLPELEKSVHFISLNQHKGFRLKKISLLHKVIRNVNPDVIHSHLSVLLYLYFLSLMNFRKRFYYSIHTLAEKACPNLFFKVLNFIFYSFRIIKVIAISDECKKSYEKFYGLKNATLINNGRKKCFPTLSYPEVTNEIDTYKLNKSDLVFIHVARYHEQKNQQLLIDVFNRLANEGFGYTLLIIGDWLFCDEAKELAKSANERIHFLGTKKNVSDYLFLSDAFCLTSIYEGLPISLLEALSCGCNPVCTPVGGIKDSIQNGITGFLSDNVYEESYYNAIKRFMNQRDIIKKEDLIKYFEENYSIEQAALKHIHLYKTQIQVKKRLQ